MLKSQRRAKGRLNRNILLMTISAAVNCDSKGNGQLLSPSSANLYSAHGRMLRLHQYDLWFFKLIMMITLGKFEWAELTVYRHELAAHPDHPLSISLARAIYVHANQVAKEADAVEHA